MFKTSLAVVAAAVGLMVGTALIAGRNGPPGPAQSNSDASMTIGQQLPSFVVKPDPKLKSLRHHSALTLGGALVTSQTATPAVPAVPAAPSVTPATPPAPLIAPVAPPAATVVPAPAPTATPAPPAAPPEVAPPSEANPLLSTDLTADHRTKGGFLNFLRFIISSVARFMSTAEENLWVIMFGTAFTLFLTTGFWQFHAISDERQKNKGAGNGGTGGACGGSCKTKGPCH